MKRTLLKNMVSIVIPVYKAEKSLNRCIDSILSQTYNDWELILIDDGSPDKSGIICDEYQTRDSRIRVIHKQNGGVSSARNRGLDEAKGDRICFVDADDYLESCFLSKMVVFSHDLVVCGFCSLQGLHITPEDIDISGENMGAYIPDFFNSYSAPAPWAKLFKKEIIDKFHIRFNQRLKLTEDTIFNFEYLTHCQNLRLIPNQLYIYDGMWGGGDKYILSWDEIVYMCDTMFSTVERLQDVFNCSIDTTDIGVGRIFHMHDFFEKKTFYDVYQLFHKYHSDCSFEQFLKVRSANPASQILIYCERSYTSGNLWHALNAIHKFAVVEPSKLKSINTYNYLIYKLVYSNNLWLAYLYTICIIFLRKVKHYFKQFIPKQ